jgi:hypothetical protein
MPVNRKPYQIVKAEYNYDTGKNEFTTQDDHEFYTPDMALRKAKELAKDKGSSVAVHRDGQPWAVVYPDGRIGWSHSTSPKRKAA